MFIARRALVAFGFCLALSACVEQRTVQPEANVHAADDAEALFNNGDFERAGPAFVDLAQSDAGHRDHYRLRAAEAYREEGNLGAVTWALDGVRAQGLSANEQPRLDLLEAELALSKHDARRALTLLTLDEARLSRPLRLRALELRARAQEQTGDAFGSARTRLAMSPQLQGADRSQNEAQIVTTLTQLSPDTLKQQGASLLPNDALRPFIDQALRQAGQALPQTIAAPAQQVGTITGAQNAIEREGYRPARVIALLLPVESLKSVAQTIRDGVFSAYFSDPHLPRPELRVYDSGNTAAEAVAAYQRAVREGADYVIGPLRRDAVSAVFAQTGGNAGNAAHILALNQTEHGEAAPAGSATFGLTPDTEGAQAAQHMIDRGITRAAIMTASNDWGERAAAAFRAQFESGHGTVLGEARLHEGDINYAATIRQAMHAMPTSHPPPLPGAAVAPGQANEATDAGIFISALPQQARLLIPQVRAAGYSGTPVFATSHVFGGTVNADMDRDLDGIEFCDAPWLFDAVVGLPRYSDMAASIGFSAGVGARLFALGMDAYALVPYIDWMNQHHDAYVPGASGQLTTDAAGRVQRLLIWARFNDGVAMPVNGSLQMSAVSPR